MGPILALARFTEPYRFNLFAERKISAIVSAPAGEIELSGEPDGIIATGYREPPIPLFAFTAVKIDRGFGRLGGFSRIQICEICEI